MDKATPTPASVDSVMALFVTAANARASWMETGFNRADAEQAEASLRAEVERLAAQAAGAPAVRMPKEVHVQADTIEDIKRAFSELSADKRIPADGKIGGV